MQFTTWQESHWHKLSIQLKCKLDGSVECDKASLMVPKGCAQEKGIDFEETFASTCHMTTGHSAHALIAHHG